MAQIPVPSRFLLRLKKTGLLPFLLVLMGLSGCSPKEDGQDLLILEPTHDFGEALQKSSVTHSFVLKNVGKRELRIEGVEKSCGCTEAVVDKKNLKPGESAHLQTTLSTLDRVGPMNVFIKVKWKRDHGQSHLSETHLQGKILRHAIIEPAVCDFGPVDVEGKPSVISVRVRRGDSGLSWDSVVASGFPGNAVKVVDENTFEIPVTLNPKGKAIGLYKGGVSLSLGNKADKSLLRFEVPVMASIVGKVEAVPSSLYFGILKPGEIKNGHFKIRSKTGQAVEMLSVKAVDSGGMEVKIVSDPLKNEEKIDCVLNATGLNADTSGKILVKVRLEGKAYELAVPFIAYVKSPEKKSG